MLDLNLDQTKDLWTGTLSKYPHKGRIEYLQLKHSYPFLDQWMHEDKVEFQGGTDIKFLVMTGTAGTAKAVSPGERRKYIADDVMETLTVPWRQINAHWTTNHQEILRNMSGTEGKGKDAAERLVNLVMVRRAGARLDIADLIETFAIGVPADANDVTTPYGLKYWVVKPTSAQQTAGTYGHIGANPLYADESTTIGTCGGIDASLTDSRWRNAVYSWKTAAGVAGAQPSEMPEDDVNTIIRACMAIHFKGPVTVKDLYDGTYDNFRWYTNAESIIRFTAKARANNDNLGTDFGMYAGSVRIKGNPIIPVDELATDASNPLFGINHDTFKPVILRGDYFRETGPLTDWGLPDMFAHNIDLTYNMLCENRRKNCCIANPNHAG